MNQKIIIHIPHASLNLPDIFYEHTLKSKEEIEKENIFISDYLVDKFLPNNYANIIKFNYSRLFCDVERFKNDKLETMSKYGMGAIYEQNSNGEKFINLTQEYKEIVLNKYYDLHHQLLDKKTTEILKKYNECYIIDLHSFSDEFVKKILKLENNPDICIGYDNNFCDINLINKTIEHFKKYGFIVENNYPYSGSIIPNKYYNLVKTNLYSLMIEVNKRIYLDNNISLNKKKYQILKQCMDNYYLFLNDYTLDKKLKK